jgi:hypothetical protein
MVFDDFKTDPTRGLIISYQTNGLKHHYFRSTPMPAAPSTYLEPKLVMGGTNHVLTFHFHATCAIWLTDRVQKSSFPVMLGLVTGMFSSGTEKTMVVDFHCGRPLKSSTQKLLRIPFHSSSYAIRDCHDIPASQGFASASFSKRRLL